MSECPRCERPLSSIRVAGIELDLCCSRGGLWLDQSEALSLAGVLGIRPAQPSTGLTCGRCGRSRLRPAEVICTEAGFLCDRCHAGQEAAVAGISAVATAARLEGNQGLTAGLLTILVSPVVD